MRHWRASNGLLRSLLLEAGWTGDRLARTVNALGAESGIRLRYQRASVAQWLAGVRPRPPVPEFVAEAFSRALGRHVTAEATGLTPSGVSSNGAGLTRWWAGDAVAMVVELGSQDMSREAMATYVYDLTGLSIPGWVELVASCQDGPRDAPVAARVGRDEVNSIIFMTGMFSDLDAAFGGGHARFAMSSYVSTTIAPWLRANASSVVRRELLAAAARLAYLGGFMCFDDELNGAAQRYYLASLRLAAEAGDDIGASIVLRALSVQARALGHHQQALHLAEAAVRTASRVASARTRAFLLGQLAVADAATGDRRAAWAHLTAAERHLEHVGDDAIPVGAYHPSSLAHQQAAVAAFSGDRHAAIAALQDSIRHRPALERRSRAITLARLAELQLRDGDLTQAVESWGRFLYEYPHLRSRRADTAFATLRASIRPHQDNVLARALAQRAASMNRQRRC